MNEQFPMLEELVEFINERWKIHLDRKTAKQAPPWTEDPILQKYRFCNVRREDDRVTKWIHDWSSGSEDPDLWFVFYFSRIFNKPATLELLGWPTPWNRRKAFIHKKLLLMRGSGIRMFNAAYIVSSHGRRVESKVEYYMEVFDELWTNHGVLRPLEDDTLQQYFDRLVAQKGIGSFMGAQVIADLKHFQPLCSAPDWFTFAAGGPGSRRGLNWVTGRQPLPRWLGGDWHTVLLELRKEVLPSLPRPLRTLDAQNLQNCLCEFSKYCKVKYAGGRAKQLFKPSEEPYS